MQGNEELYRFSFVCLFVAAVHCEEFSGGEHGEDPEEEAGPGGEDVWLSYHRQAHISHGPHSSSVGAVDDSRWCWFFCMLPPVLTSVQLQVHLHVQFK